MSTGRFLFLPLPLRPRVGQRLVPTPMVRGDPLWSLLLLKAWLDLIASSPMMGSSLPT